MKDKKMCKFTFIVIFLLMSTLFLGFMSTPVLGELVTETNARIDWDDFDYGVTSGAGTFYDWYRSAGNDFYIYNGYVNSSPKSLKLYCKWHDIPESRDVIDEGHINVDLDHYIEDITINMTVKITHSSGEEGCLQHFAIKNGSTVVCNFAYKNRFCNFEPFGYAGTNIDDEILFVYNYTTSTWDSVCSLATATTERLDIRIFPSATRDKCMFTVDVDGTPYSSEWLIFSDAEMFWGNITKIRITGLYDTTGGGTYSNIETFLDDIIFGFPSAPPPPTYDVSMWDYYGELTDFGKFTTPVGDEFLEEQRQVRMTTEIKAVDLMVDAGQKSISSDLNTYFLSINGHTPVNPVAFIPFDNRYLIRWCYTNISILDEYPTFEFYSSEHNDLNWYWNVETTGIDTDNDNDVLFRYGSDDDDWANGLYDAEHPRQGQDLEYRFYFPFGDAYKPPQAYDDTIDTDKNTYNQFDDVFISYTVESALTVNKLVINRDSTEISNSSFSGYSGFYMYTPISSGDYTAEIFRDGETQATCSFTVNPIDSDYWLYTIPNPSLPSTSFTIYFNYNYSLHPCAILLYNCYSLDTPIKRWIFEDVPINSSISYTINAEGVYYFDLAYRLNGHTYTSLLRKTHTVKNSYTNIIYAQIESIDGDECNVLWGSHNYLGRNVRIRVNGEIMSNDDNDCNLLPSKFSEVYCPMYSGDYLVELLLIQSDEIFILSSCTFSVTAIGFDPVPPEKTALENLMDLIPDFYKIIAGIIITILITISPILLVSQIAQFANVSVDFKIPAIVYPILAIGGTVLCVTLGLYGIEITFFFLAICLIAGFLVYYTGNGGNG